MSPWWSVLGVNRRGFLRGAVAAGSLLSFSAPGGAAQRSEDSAAKETPLFLTERGRVLLHNNEEISRWRRAKKRLRLPAAAARAGADLWILLQMYEGNRAPLEVFLNGAPLARIEPDASLTPCPIWSRVEVSPGRLLEGANDFELRASSSAMNSWMVCLEPGHRDPESFISTDGGASWRNHDMGVYNVLRGEYVIRLRSCAEPLRDPPPPPLVYEDPSHPRVKESLELVPAGIRGITDPWEQVLALRTWVARSWAHRASGPIYTPWDPWTILDWAKMNRGEGREDTICMCVHFATLFAALAAALGHGARCAVITEALDKQTGHFMAEVWDARLKRWILHDPNFDVHYADGEPLSMIDLARHAHQGRTFADWLVTGEGMPRGPAGLIEIFHDYFVSGKSFRLSGIWSRNDYVSDPAAAPPSHGSVSYCEPEIVWYSPAGMDLAPMFPYRVAERGYFDAMP